MQVASLIDSDVFNLLDGAFACREDGESTDDPRRMLPGAE